jgi:hypothetical protein
MLYGTLVFAKYSRTKCIYGLQFILHGAYELPLSPLFYYRNVQCGKLWCVGNGAIIEKNLGYGTYWTRATLDRRRITCR